MQKIYIEVTNLIKTNSMTGIQRVERSIALEIYKKLCEQLCFITFNEKNSKFEILNLEDFIVFAKGDNSVSNKMHSGSFIAPEQMKPGDIFFEYDAVWNENCKSSVLLPKLKRNGVRIACYIYDIIPINYPQFSQFAIRFNFMNYIGAYLQYADVIISSSQSTLNSIHELAEKLGLKKIPGFVSWHGSDFNGLKRSTGNLIPKEVIEATQCRYILSVGTIEPRKNYKFLLDAFDSGLFNKDCKLIFAGKIGWNVEDLKERMEKHPEKGNKFFHFTGLSDEAIDYLYSHAFLVAFPTYAEGFGLPIIESLKRGTPVLATDIPVLREVGKRYCRYFELNNIEDFTNKLVGLLENPFEYEKLKEEVNKFEPSTWEETANKVIAALDTLKIVDRKAKDNVKQMVILTARVDDIKRTVPYIERYMPFVEKLLLCCPDKVAEDMKAIKTERINIDTLTDGEILNGKPLPEDHGTRNFFLRCLAMKSDKIDDVFLMGDDDYRPLKTIDLNMFFEEDSYVAYYCNRLNEWKGVVGALTSYDRQLFATRDFVNENGYPDYQYSSHMPQVIDKELFLEMINEHKGVESTGLDEWTSYFNFAQAKYPNLIKRKPYVTANWPGLLTDWKLYVKPSDFCFENFYKESYAEGRIYEGLSYEFNENADSENRMKIARSKTLVDRYFSDEKIFEDFCNKELKEKLEYPSFVIKDEGDGITIGAPQNLVFAAESIMHLTFRMLVEKEGLSLQLKISSKKGTLQRMPVSELIIEDIKLMGGSLDKTLICGGSGTPKGEYVLSVIIDDGNNQYIKDISLKLV